MTASARRQMDWAKFARSIGGLALAPIAGGAVAFAAESASELNFMALPRLAALGGYFGAIFGVLPALVIGYPIHVLLMRMKWTHPAIYAAVGVVMAGVGYALATTGLSLLGPWND